MRLAHSQSHSDKGINTITNIYDILYVRHGGALIETMPFNRRVVGSNSALAAMLEPGQVLHLQLPVPLRRVNSDTVSITVVGSASERLML